MSIDLRRATPGRPGILLVVLGVLTGVFVLLAVAVATEWGPLMDLDADVARAAYDVGASSALLVSSLELAAVVFSTWSSAVVLAAIAGYGFWRREWRLGTWVLLSAVTALLVKVLLKLLFVRERPPWDAPLHEASGYSFPSGHATGAGVFFTVLVLLTIILTGRGWRRRLVLALWVVLGIFVAASRVFLGVHYLSDVAAGLAMGISVTLALWLLVAIDPRRLPSKLAMTTGTGGRRVAVVLNPAKVGPVEEFKAKVRLVSAKEGWTEPLWFETTVEDPGHGQATAALQAGVDLIIAAGGDGTVRAVCEEVARTGVAVAIIPHGTGNLLARNLGVPLNARDALEAAFGGQDKAVDLATFRTDGEVDTVFLVMAGLGMDAMIMTGVDDKLKEKVGWAAYFVSGVKALRFPGMKVEISVDDEEPRKFRARTVVIGNVGFLQGGIPLLPAAEIDDGLLDVVVLAPRRFFGWVGIAWRVITRRKRTNQRLDRFTGSRVHVKASSATPMQLDGDPVGEGTEITAEVHPGVLLVRVPVVPVVDRV
ncbi:phosphatase PAP2 family protein [Aeromicrobium sp. CTD01-1L150]|uniref:phosphatase PAP2 family protein n=1 Tax=Aeromicrobium sp. CTD01-1L150 TaxID=3341830 RepID=UPI0035BF32DD